jgi:hypothetical protein
MNIGRMWQDYWFRPSSLFDLAVCRVVCVGIQVVLLFQGRDILLEHSTLPDSFYNPLLILRLILWPFSWAVQSALLRPSHETISVIYWTTLAAGGFASIGALTRIALPLFAFGSLFLNAFKWSFNDYHHPDAIMIIFLCVLALSPAGGTLSLDDLSARFRKAVQQKRFEAPSILEVHSRFARFPLLLAQHLLAFVYLNAALSKLWVAGSDWLNGYTLQYYLWRDGLDRGSEIGVWLGQQHILAVLLSWFTLLFEGTFFLVLIFPVLIWLYIPLGLGLHLGMCLSSLACFIEYFALYVVFVPWAKLVKAASRVFQRDKLRVAF